MRLVDDIDEDEDQDQDQDQDRDACRDPQAWAAENRRLLKLWHPHMLERLDPIARQILETGRIPPRAPAVGAGGQAGGPGVETQGEQYGMALIKKSKQLVSSADFAEDYLGARPQLRKHRGQWLRYNGVYYEPLSDDELKADIRTYFIQTPSRDRVKKAFVSEIMDHLEAVGLIPMGIVLPARQTETGWDHEPETMTFQNGVIDLTGVQLGFIPRLEPHSPRFVSTCVLPYDYDPKATCPTWLKVLEDILPDEDSRRLLQQIFGHCLTFDLKYQKFFLFVGSGGNGKSLVTSILRRVVGVQNISSVPLSRFNDKHALVGTYGKLVNLTGELREKDTIAEDQLKQATGGDMMQFEPKYRDAFFAPFTAKIILCTNELPAFTDRSNGIWRRLIVLPFPVSIPPDRQDPDLETELAAELPGILNWAIRGAVDLAKAGRFEVPQPSVEAMTSFKEQANPERVFFNESCQLRPDASIGTQELYDAYRTFTERTGHKPMSGTKFKVEALKLPGVTTERVRQDGGRPHVYRGITIEICPPMTGGL